MKKQPKAPAVRIKEEVVCRNIDQLRNFVERIAELWDERKAIRVELRTIQNTRTLPQNSLLHAWIGELTNFLNENKPAGMIHSYDEPWVKNRLKQRFGERITLVDPYTGEEKQYLKSTAQYTVGEMYWFMCAIQSDTLERYGLMLESTGEFKEYQDNNGQIPAETA